VFLPGDGDHPSPGLIFAASPSFQLSTSSFRLFFPAYFPFLQKLQWNKKFFSGEGMWVIVRRHVLSLMMSPK
jgi:hypothetical protein